MTRAGLEHASCRELVLDGAESLAGTHLKVCAACADFASRVATVRHLAPELAGPGPAPGLAERVIAEVRGARPPSPAPRSPHWRRFRPVLGVVATAALFVALVVLPLRTSRSAGAVSLSNALLTSAHQTEALGTARLRLEGQTDLIVRARPGAVPRRLKVTFGGTGELGDRRLHYRGTTRVASQGGTVELAPFELTVIGNDAWTRRPDGSWLAVGRDDAAGPLAPLVLDADSVIELLRLPKESLREVGGRDEVAGEPVRHLRFTVRPSPGLRYLVDAWVGAGDDVLRQVAIAATGIIRDGDGSVVHWSSTGTVRLFGFGQRVVIAAPHAGEVVGPAAGGSAPAAAAFPFPTVFSG